MVAMAWTMTSWDLVVGQWVPSIQRHGEQEAVGADPGHTTAPGPGGAGADHRDGAPCVANQTLLGRGEEAAFAVVNARCWKGRQSKQRGHHTAHGDGQ